MRSTKLVSYLVGVVAGFLVYFAWQPDAGAVPSFSRKYQTSCLTCHTVYPMLNAFGEAFRRNGYRMPSTKNSVDSDSIKSAMIPLGQEEYRSLFPSAVIPDKIMESVPLSVMLNGAVTMNFPDSDARTAAGNVFTWNGVEGELHLFAAGAFNDNLTYFSQLTIPINGQVDVETGYLLWNDIFGPRHMVNLWIGRLFAPQLTSFGLHSSYLSDTNMPNISIAGLYNPTGSWAVGQSHNDGIELNGIIGHRFAYAVGWLASAQANGLTTIDAEDVYAHIGIKTGGIALDGEGKYGPNPPDPMKPWQETSLTLDLFAYHGMNLLDNGTGSVAANTTPGAPVLTNVAVGQRDSIGVLGGQLRGQVGSLIATAGLEFEHHDAPYQGTQATAAGNGTPDLTHGDAWVQYNEIDYVIYPWLVPGVRTELTTMTLEPGSNAAGSSQATLFRVIPGVAMLLRPNVRVILTGDLEYAYGVPVVGSWASAGGAIVAPAGQASKLEAETLTATVSVAF